MLVLKKRTSIFLLLLLVLSNVRSKTHLGFTRTYEFEIRVEDKYDPTSFIVFGWNIVNDTWEMGMAGQIEGYMAAGITKGGGMTRLDCWVGWLEGDTLEVEDFYVDGLNFPTPDTSLDLSGSKDVIPVFGAIQQMEGAFWRVVEMDRPLVTQDSLDHSITNLSEPVTLSFAWHTISSDFGRMHTHRGSLEEIVLSSPNNPGITSDPIENHKDDHDEETEEDFWEEYHDHIVFGMTSGIILMFIVAFNILPGTERRTKEEIDVEREYDMKMKDPKNDEEIGEGDYGIEEERETSSDGIEMLEIEEEKDLAS